MSEYIERKALILHIKDLPTWWADAGGVYGKAMKYPDGMFDCEDVISSIENAPAADVIKVVRCEDCLHYGMGICLKIYYAGSVSQYAWQEREPYDYCSYGEGKG